jgi:hypothetical protein
MDDRGFVDGLMAAVPEAFTHSRDAEDLRKEPLAYIALAHARIWLEENALQVSAIRRRARLRSEHADAFRRYWDFIETQARGGKGDVT